MRRILMSDEIKGQIEMLAGAQLICRYNIVAFFLFGFFSKQLACQVASVSTAERFIFFPQRQVCRSKCFPPAMAIVQILMNKLGRGFDVTGLTNAIYNNRFIRYVMNLNETRFQQNIDAFRLPRVKRKKNLKVFDAIKTHVAHVAP
jgi:hypothetical protein